MALALAKCWALDVLRGSRPEQIGAAIDAHARAISEEFGTELARGGGVTPGARSARTRSLASPAIEELCRLLYGARRSADGRLGPRLLEPQILAVSAQPQSGQGFSELAFSVVSLGAGDGGVGGSGGGGVGGGVLTYARGLAAVDLCLRSDRVVVIDHGTDIIIWIGEDAGGEGGKGPVWLSQLQSEAAELALERAPPASLMTVREGDSMSRWAIARLEPLHNDPADAQRAQSRCTMTWQMRSALRAAAQ
ncbi:hypothetical protein T492DRAFT_850081 [Pavlovales sp. CCMP2436]|nr:hypothetical protein T492DRAFT_850081 [Pavlovales sp. CCMP2436]